MTSPSPCWLCWRREACKHRRCSARRFHAGAPLSRCLYCPAALAPRESRQEAWPVGYDLRRRRGTILSTGVAGLDTAAYHRPEAGFATRIECGRLPAPGPRPGASTRDDLVAIPMVGCSRWWFNATSASMRGIFSPCDERVRHVGAGQSYHHGCSLRLTATHTISASVSPIAEGSERVAPIEQVVNPQGRRHRCPEPARPV